MDKAKLQGRGHTLSTKLTLARRAQLQALQLANDVKILIQWLSHDILALADPAWEERQELFDFIVAELSQRENLLAHHLRPLRTALKNQRDDLLAFAQVLDEKLVEIAQRFDTLLYLVRAVCLLHRKKRSSCPYWQRWNHLHHLCIRKISSPDGGSEPGAATNSQSQFFGRKSQLRTDLLVQFWDILQHPTVDL
ncbi:MAG: hypothetical protein JO235_06415 [Chroococcidiopsidaceae cyanobacterium CP_BM_RX_35]|nr:hypothetical protein [Chroococcidiopsidaceae cyanobacterium CP_BM_RX_35]